MCNPTSTRAQTPNKWRFKEEERRNMANMFWLVQDPHCFAPAETRLLEDRTVAGAS